MEINSFKDLIVWQKSIYLVKEIYKISKRFPDEERFGLTSQIRRSAVSIPSNIAEGRSRGSRKDFVRFLYVSLGSLSELETQLIIAKDLEFISSVEIEDIQNLIIELSKMLNRLITKLKANT
ncbi:MAG TPA: four helix bundle protein [Candidatus Dojkabacteria bacterium]|jgi:four helix bundle protein